MEYTIKRSSWREAPQTQHEAAPKRKDRRSKRAYGTWYSQAVTHPSTNQARRCLTSVIGRELVLSTWYGRKRKFSSVTEYDSGNDCGGLDLAETIVELIWNFYDSSVNHGSGISAMTLLLLTY